MPENYGEIAYIKRNIRNAVSADVDTIQDFADYEKSRFRGFPAVTLVCSGNENSFYSSAENERVFLFTMKVFYPIENLPKLEAVSDDAKKNAEEIMEKVVDQILNSLDTTTDFTLDGAGDNGIEAVPSSWGYALLGTGWCRVATIEIRVRRILLVN